MHAIFYGYSTVHFPDFQILSAMPNVHYQLRNADDFFVCRTNSTFIKNMPLIDFPNTWNNLDNGYKEIRSKLLFKKNKVIYLINIVTLDVQKSFVSPVCLSLRVQ